MNEVLYRSNVITIVLLFGCKIIVLRCEYCQYYGHKKKIIKSRMNTV